MNKGDKKKRIIYSAINGLLGSGVLTSGFCIYVALAFHERIALRFKCIFGCTGILFVAFLLLQGVHAIRRARTRQYSVSNILKDGFRIFVLSILCIIPGWYFWAFVDWCYISLRDLM